MIESKAQLINQYQNEMKDVGSLKIAGPGRSRNPFIHAPPAQKIHAVPSASKYEGSA